MTRPRGVRMSYMKKSPRPVILPPRRRWPESSPWSFSLAVFDATTISRAADLTRSSAVPLPAVCNLLSGLLAPEAQHCCCGPQRQPRERGKSVLRGRYACRQSNVILAATKRVSCSRVTAARRRRPRALWPGAVARLGARLGAASLPRIARKKLVATGGFEPASSKTSRRRYQLDYEAQIRYI